MDGLEAAAHIRAQAAIPIIDLTGSPEGVIPAGLTIRKPVMTQTLQQTIQVAMATMDPQPPRYTQMPRKDTTVRTTAPSVLPVSTSGGPEGQAPSP